MALVIEGETASSHCERVAALKTAFLHTIRCVDRVEEGTCVTYACGLLEHRQLVYELEGLGIKAGRSFVEWLLDEGHFIEISTAKPGALALYFNAGTWKHAGVMKGKTRLRSKWGAYFAFDHRLSEVPSDYGTDVRFFELPRSNSVACHLFNFACDKLKLGTQQEIERLRKLTGTLGLW